MKHEVISLRRNSTTVETKLTCKLSPPGNRSSADKVERRNEYIDNNINNCLSTPNKYLNIK